MIKRISITGPESTGKTELAQSLAQEFNDQWVSEFARDYLEEYGSEYTMEDVLRMSQGQWKREEAKFKDSSRFLFCDTDFTVTKIWCEVVFGHCPQWIDNKFRSHRYDLYLLCYPDLEWSPDPLRENPDNRLELFEMYQNALDEINANYRIVDGKGYERVQKAVSFVQQC
jgi:NadR type nicotinamide-nucleotide adenylyltransferase